jgi:hypothetical protein
MSKMSAYILEVQEDVINLTEDAFVEKYSVNGRVDSTIMKIYFETELESLCEFRRKYLIGKI